MTSWVEWQLSSGARMRCAPDAPVLRLLDALQAALDGAAPACRVQLRHGDAAGSVETRYWALSADRAQLWDILARHYLRAQPVGA